MITALNGVEVSILKASGGLSLTPDFMKFTAPVKFSYNDPKTRKRIVIDGEAGYYTFSNSTLMYRTTLTEAWKAYNSEEKQEAIGGKMQYRIIPDLPGEFEPICISKFDYYLIQNDPEIKNTFWITERWSPIIDGDRLWFIRIRGQESNNPDIHAGETFEGGFRPEVPGYEERVFSTCPTKSKDGSFYVTETKIDNFEKDRKDALTNLYAPFGYRIEIETDYQNRVWRFRSDKGWQYPARGKWTTALSDYDVPARFLQSKCCVENAAAFLCSKCKETFCSSDCGMQHGCFKK